MTFQLHKKKMNKRNFFLNI